MNIAKLVVSTGIRSTLTHKPTPVATITLKILETHLPLCRNLRQLNQILSQMFSSGLIRDAYAASRLLKFSVDSPFVWLDYSRRIFDHLEDINPFSWNTMMKAYLLRKCPEETIYLYKLMLLNSACPDNYTYPIVVQASALRCSEPEGSELHCHVLKMGFDSDVYVQNTLINMYAVCRNIWDAQKLFDESPVLDSVSWNSILAGYVQIGDVESAKWIYSHMPEKNVIASNSMIALLGRLGRLSEASQLLNAMDDKDVVSWTALISCYEQNELYEEALLTFMQMNSDEVIVDEVVVVSVLSACTHLLIVRTGEHIHGLAVKTGIESYVNLQNALIHMYSSCGDITAAEKLFNVSYHLDQVSWNSMISGYLRCGLVENARRLFDTMPERDIISWSSMISGYAKLEQFPDALALFQKMQLENIQPDETTLVSVLSACAHLAALDQGKWIHAYIRKTEVKVNFILGTTLIDMYMKCGCVDNAWDVFSSMDARGVSTWNALILGLAMNGLVERSLEMFSEMKMCGVVPNEITFIGVLGACRHMGLVDEGRQHFDSMINLHKIEPNVKHYGCMVDLLGRAGMLKEAEELIESMPMPPDVSTWGALLAACKQHGDNEMGERVGRKLIDLQPHHDGFHVLLSNICASKGNWGDVTEIRDMMKKQSVLKTPGCSMIEADGVVHEFLAGDDTHPQMGEIETMLDEVAKRLKKLGYTPDTKQDWLDIDEEEKATHLLRHGEKLSIFPCTL